jgi:hypothetical protein
MAPIPSNVPRSFQSWPSPGITATPTDFNLDAGVYGLSATWGVGTAQLQKLMPDGVTWVPITAALAAPGGTYAVLQLPAGRYRMVLAGGVTAFIGEIALIARGGFR